MATCCACGETDLNPAYWFCDVFGQRSGLFCADCCGKRVSGGTDLRLVASYGWVCPECGRIYGPSVTQCSRCVVSSLPLSRDCSPIFGEAVQSVVCRRCSHPTSTLVSDARGAAVGQVKCCYARLTPEGRWEKGCAYEEIDKTTKALLNKLFDW